MRTKLFYFFIFLSLFLIPGFSFAQDTIETYYEKAIILDFKETIKEEAQQDSEVENKVVVSVQEIDLKILSGKFKGLTKTIENSLLVNPADLDIKQGDKVIVYIQELSNSEVEIQIHDYYRFPYMIFLISLFFVLLIIVGASKGLRSAISLFISVLLIFKVFIPLILKGTNPIWLALLISSVITVITFFIISGSNKKTFAAILGTVGGLLCATIIVISFGNLLRLNGLSSEEARILAGSFSLNFQGLLFSGIIIAALGAVMDVSMSIASGMSEIKKAKPDITKRKLVTSGMEIGKDIIGTMANTLIFAYVGSSLFILLSFTNFGESYLKFLNFDFFAEEVLGAMAGSIGLILAVPITAIVAGFLETKK